MTETCYVTQVRLLTQPAPIKTQKSSQRFSFASIPWPFLPQVSIPSSESVATTPTATTCVNSPTLRQRRVVSSSPASAVTPSSFNKTANLRNKMTTAANKFKSSLPSWPAFALLILQGVRSSIAQSLLNVAVRTCLLVLIGEIIAVLASLIMANKVPPGLLFMVAALLFLGYIANNAIGHDSAAIRRRKSSMNLLKR